MSGVLAFESHAVWEAVRAWGWLGVLLLIAVYGVAYAMAIDEPSGDPKEYALSAVGVVAVVLVLVAAANGF